MLLIIRILVGLIAVEHLFILWIEMFAWTKKGEKFFSQLDADFLEKTKGMAANQGLYNGFLAAGLMVGHHCNRSLGICHCNAS